MLLHLLFIHNYYNRSCILYWHKIILFFLKPEGKKWDFLKLIIHNSDLINVPFFFFIRFCVIESNCSLINLHFLYYLAYIFVGFSHCNVPEFGKNSAVLYGMN